MPVVVNPAQQKVAIHSRIRPEFLQYLLVTTGISVVHEVVPRFRIGTGYSSHHPISIAIVNNLDRSQPIGPLRKMVLKVVLVNMSGTWWNCWRWQGFNSRIAVVIIAAGTHPIVW